MCLISSVAFYWFEQFCTFKKSFHLLLTILFKSRMICFFRHFFRCVRSLHRWKSGEITSGLWPVFWAKMRPVHWNFSWFSPSSKFQTTTTTHMIHDFHSCFFSKKSGNIFNIIKTISYRLQHMNEKKRIGKKHRCCTL